MDNPNSKKRNADGEIIGGVQTANDARKTDSMVPAPGEDDTSQPLPKRPKLQRFVENNGRMNDTVGDSSISNKSPECSQSLTGDTGLDKGTEECITVRVSTFIAAGAPPTESPTTTSDTEGDDSVDLQAQSQFINGTKSPVNSKFVHNMDRPSASRMAEDIGYVTRGQDEKEIVGRSILYQSHPWDQVEGQPPPLTGHETPPSTQECIEGWKAFFNAISLGENIYDGGSDK